MKTFASELIETVEDAFEKLLQVGDEEASVRPAAGEWSKKEIVGHLIDSTANNHHRFIRAQQTSELVFPAYEQEEWVRLQSYRTCPWPELVGLWRLYNLHMARIAGHISPDKLDTVCRIGANDPVPLEFLVHDYLQHLRLQLRQQGL